MAIVSNFMIDKLNLRIKNEEMSSRIYKAMSLWLNLNGFSGAAKLWMKYSNEELVHANWAIDYLLDLSILPETPALEKPMQAFKGLPYIVALSYQHEVEITNQCKELAQAALKEDGVTTFGLAQKYVAEQVEELKKIQYWLDRLEAFGASKEALFLLDNEMGEQA